MLSEGENDEYLITKSVDSTDHVNFSSTTGTSPPTPIFKPMESEPDFENACIPSGNHVLAKKVVLDASECIFILS